MARKRGYRGEEEEVSYWKSTADAILGLLFIVLLILALLATWLVTPQVDEEGLEDSEGTYEDVGEGYDNTKDEDNDDEDDEDNSDGGGGGDGGGDNQNNSDFTGQGLSEYDGTSKSAILVVVRDGETGKVIPEKDVTFTLSSTRTGLLRLHTYYPQQIQYDDFKTTERGQFYLPEKIVNGEYYLHEMTEPKGYDGSDDIYFTVNQEYDWNEPLTVYVDLMPCQNTIRIQLDDMDTHAKIPNAQYQIIAAEDITTMDGTVRYQKGKVVDSVTTNEEGFAESIPLYLGKYTVHPSEMPKGTILTEDYTVEVEKKDEYNDKTETLSTQQTRVNVTLTDEADENIKLADVKLELTSSQGDRQNAVTDSAGRVTFTELEKNATYQLKQVTRVDDYQLPEEAVEFYVDANGYIDGEAAKTVALTNRTLRLEIVAQDALLRRGLSGYELTLYNMDGEIVDSWNSGNGAFMAKGLEVGTYTVADNQHPDKMTRIEVKDTAEIQRGYHVIWTDTDTVLIIAAVVVIAGVITLIVFVWRKRKGKRRTDIDV